MKLFEILYFRQIKENVSSTSNIANSNEFFACYTHRKQKRRTDI